MLPIRSTVANSSSPSYQMHFRHTTPEASTRSSSSGKRYVPISIVLYFLSLLAKQSSSTLRCIATRTRRRICEARRTRGCWTPETFQVSSRRWKSSLISLRRTQSAPWMPRYISQGSSIFPGRATRLFDPRLGAFLFFFFFFGRNLLK